MTEVEISVLTVTYDDIDDANDRDAGEVEAEALDIINEKLPEEIEDDFDIDAESLMVVDRESGGIILD